MTTIDQIAEFLKPATLKLRDPGTGQEVISGPAPIDLAGPGQVCFCGATARRPGDLLKSTRASLLILDRALAGENTSQSVAAVIESDNARLDFMRVIGQFFAPVRPRGISDAATIADTAK